MRTGFRALSFLTLAGSALACLAPGCLALLLAPGLAAPAAAQEPPAVSPPSVEPQNVAVGQQELRADYLAGRRQAQLEAAKQLGVFHDFRFDDVLLDSGITFKHEPTDDGLKDYAMVHYDHGNGVLVADVDGDDKLDLYFVTQLGPNELWKNLGGGKFQNITAEAGVALEARVSVTGSFADVDNDGDADLMVTTVRMGNVLFVNDGKGRFTDVSKAAGVDHVGHSSSPVFFDYDRDGRLDLFVANVGRYTHDEKGRGGYYVGMQDAFSGHLKPERYERSLLYRNVDGQRFEDVTEKTGLIDEGWTGDATPIDFNRDLYPDLYVLNMQGDDHYWENDGGERFVEKTAEYFPKTPWGAMGVKVFDFDNNGLDDVVLTDMHSDMSKNIGPEKEKLKAEITWEDKYLQGRDNNVFGNALYQQVAPGEFREVSDAMGVENYWPWGVSAGDLNADGWEDLLITSSMNYPYRYGVNSLLLNDAGKKFADAEFVLGIEPRVHGFTMRPWFPLDCGGADAEHEHCKESNATGPVLIWGALGSRTSAIFDLDDDGDLDIVTGEFNGRPQVFVSNLAEKRQIRYLKVRLAGTKSNRDGLGARVTVVAGGRTYSKTHDGKSGYLSQSRMPLYFGLGDATAVDRVEVEWPSGVKQVVPSQGVNRLLEIVEEGEVAAASG